MEVLTILFYKEHENYIYTNLNFLKQTNTIVGSIDSIHAFMQEFPSISSATDKGLQTPLKKIYSEHLERSNIGFALNSENTAISFDLLNKEINYNTLSSLSYGINYRFGYVDTTGTGARNSDSKGIIVKAISELIEKNELLLFWYLGKGKPIIHDSFILSKLKTFGLECYENYFFECRNLSNWPTVIHIACKNYKIVSTGVSCNSTMKKSIEGAINETKTLRTLNMMRFKSWYDCSDDTHTDAIEYISKLEKGNIYESDTRFNKIPFLCMEIADWIKNLEISFIGHKKTQSKIVTAFSDSLIKCVPSKSNLKYCTDVDIYKRYHIGDISENVECIVL